MTILVFWSVLSKLGRHDLDNLSYEEAFKELWSKRDDIDAKFYDVESFGGRDLYGLQKWLGDADDFETDYNDEILDGGLWCKAISLPSRIVSDIIHSTEKE